MSCFDVYISDGIKTALLLIDYETFNSFMTEVSII